MEVNLEKPNSIAQPADEAPALKASPPALSVARQTVARPARRVPVSRSPGRQALARLGQNKLAVAGAVIIGLLLVVAVFAPWIAPYDYTTQNYQHVGESPSGDFWFGTDQLGRDLFSRVIYGTRISLLVGLVSQTVALLIGVPIGVLAGYWGGKLDMALMRLVDVVYAFPTLLFVILLMSMLGPGLFNIILALSLTGWVTLARLVRGEFLKLRESEFVLAARSIGASPARIIWRHLLPNALSPIIVSFTFGIPTAIFAEASLSFIGVGINPPTPSWGQMVGENYQYIRSLWHLAVFPVVAIALTMLGFSFLGDGLRDALDPRGSSPAQNKP